MKRSKQNGDKFSQHDFCLIMCRNVASPNASFIAQLLGWGKRLGTEVGTNRIVSDKDVSLHCCSLSTEISQRNRLFRIAWLGPELQYPRWTPYKPQSNENVLDPRTSFMLQTDEDLIYLWRGSECPDSFWRTSTYIYVLQILNNSSKSY